MTISFRKKIELNESSFVKLPMRSSPMLKIENDDENFFIWSILAHLFSIADAKKDIQQEHQRLNNVLPR